MSGAAKRRPSAGNSHTRRLINSALDALQIKHDKRFNAGIPELQRAELMLYGRFSTSTDALYRWQQVLIAVHLRDTAKGHILNQSRHYLREGFRALQRGDLSVARGYLRSARWDQDKYEASQ